ncbi:MAG: DsbA family protein [Gammaproteobacteria bacterium]|nr:DsbA family protein [Gammaproteobacteria bacterium]
MERILWYFADPMCSWCWGFAPVIEQLVPQYRERIPISLVVGGLQPGTTEALSTASRDEIFHHWHDVHKLTVQPFKFDNALPEGFVYNTEPACRAAVTIPQLDPQATFPYFIRLQQAFYQQGEDITQQETLASIAEEFEIDKKTFVEQWLSAEINEKTQRNFEMTRQYGVRGFPTLIMQDKHEAKVLTHGYSNLETIQPLLDSWLLESEQRSQQAEG